MTVLELNQQELIARRSFRCNPPKTIARNTCLTRDGAGDRIECERFYLSACSCGMGRVEARSARCRACINCRWRKVSVKRNPPRRSGVKAVILFGIPAEKDPIGLENFAQDGIVQQAIRAIKKEIPEMVVVTDVCLV